MVQEGTLSGRPRALILGADGMLGQALRRSFAARAIVESRDRDVDIADAEAVADTCDVIQPAVVVNAAGYTDVDGAEAEPEEAFRVNGEGVGVLAECCARRSIPLITIGTDYVFDGRKSEPYGEEDGAAPLSVYGHSKLEGERRLRDVGGETLLVRSQGLYGEGRSNFVTFLLERTDPALETPIVEDRVSQPTYVRDLARAVADLWEAGARGVVHVANRGPVSWYDFARWVQEETGFPKGALRPIRTAERGEPAARPAYSALRLDRFEAVVGRPMRGVREALRAYLVNRAGSNDGSVTPDGDGAWS